LGPCLTGTLHPMRSLMALAMIAVAIGTSCGSNAPPTTTVDRGVPSTAACGNVAALTDATARTEAIFNERATWKKPELFALHEGDLRQLESEIAGISYAGRDLRDAADPWGSVVYAEAAGRRSAVLAVLSILGDVTVVFAVPDSSAAYRQLEATCG
jgi:hypothetical protein